MLWTGGSQAMNYLIRTTRRRFLALAGATVLLAGGMGASALFTGGTADAAACTGANPSGTACTITGTLDLTGGTLTMTTPTALGWGTTITGADQLLSDPTAADETYTVDDATGSAAGWHVTASATAFTSTVPTTATLGTSGALTATFATNGSLGLTAGALSTTAPTAACAASTTCTVGTNSVAGSYPVTITAGQAATVTPVNVYDAPIGSGVGTIVVGGSTAANPVGWWLNVPSNTLVGTYTSTISLELISGP